MKRNWVLCLLALVYALSLLDRSVMGLLLDAIKADMQVSDTIMGLVTGFGFAIIYSLSGIPIALWADRASRRNIISGGLAIFSLATSLSGFAMNIYHLLIGRLCLAVGEATQLAPSVSLLADLYPKQQRARAMSVFSMGPGIGIIFGLSAAGFLNEHYGWRIALIVIGMPGLILAMLLRFSTTEPERGAADDANADKQTKSLAETVRFLLIQKSYWLLLLAAALNAWLLFGATLWGPAFMGRVHHLGSAQIGLYFGIVYGVLGLFGALAGGFVSDFIGKKNESRKLNFPVVAAALNCPAALLFLLADQVWLSVMGLGTMAFMANVLLGPIWAILQSVSKIRMRSMAAALFQVMTSIIGLGLGPFLIGYFSDLLNASTGDMAIRYAMLMLLPVAAIIASVLMFIASRFIQGDVERTAENVIKL